MPTNDLAATLLPSLRAHPAVVSAELAGSRGRGDANDLSDWDFVVYTSDFPALATDLPVVVAPLRPILQQWDRLSDEQCYMLMLTDATKVDFIFPAVPNVHELPWTVSRDTLQGIDDHFWDWIIWLASKDRGGKHELLAAELQKLSAHILRPLGTSTPPGTVPAAIRAYRAARDARAADLDVTVSRTAEDAVLARLRRASYPV